MLILGIWKPKPNGDYDGAWVQMPDGRRFKVLLLEDRGAQVRIAFEGAPPDVLFHRLSLCDDQGNLKGERP